MTCIFPHLSGTISKIKVPLGRATLNLLAFLGIDSKLYQKLGKKRGPFSLPCSACCRELSELTESDEEPSLTVVRELVLEFYPRMFENQVWNFDSGKSLLHDLFHQGKEMTYLKYTYQLPYTSEWYNGELECSRR